LDKIGQGVIPEWNIILALPGTMKLQKKK